MRARMAFTSRLFHRDDAVFLPAPGDDSSPSINSRIGPAMSFNEPDDDVDPIILESMAFLEHLIGFAYTRAIAEIDL